MNNKRFAILVGAMGLALSAHAQTTLNKAANTTALNLAGSWLENQAPTSADTLDFGSGWTTPANVAMGASLSVTGINLGTLANANGRISSSAGQTLTIGAGGINGSAMTNTFRIDPAIVLSANQTWSIAGGKTLNLVANGVTATGAFTAQVTGAGTLAFNASGSGTYGNEIQIGNTIVQINFATSNVTITNAANTFTTLNMQGGTGNFSSIGNIGAASAAGTGAVTTTLGGNNTNGVFNYTGNTVSTNRTFTRDVRSTGSAINVTTAGQTLTISGNLLNVGTQAANTDWNFGGAGNLTLQGTIPEPTGVGFNQGVTKTGTGILTLAGANTYAGDTTVSVGTLLVKNTTGSGTGTGNVNVALNAAVGGSGTISNNLSIAAGGLFVFSLTDTLTVSGTVTLDNTFGVASLVNSDGSAVDWTGVAEGTYTLIANGGNFSNISNFGLANAASLGGGKSAYFQNGSLQLVVVPEPSTFALLGLSLAGLVACRRRKIVA